MTSQRPLECEYQSPLSRFSFVIHLPELHAMISFIITSLVAYFLYYLPSFGTSSALIALFIGLTLCRHMARGGRSFAVDSYLQHYNERKLQLQQQQQLLSASNNNNQQQQQQQQQQQSTSQSTTSNSSSQSSTTSQQSTTTSSSSSSSQQSSSNTSATFDTDDNNQKVAIITGASSGLGFATAQLCWDCGIHVILAVRDMNKMVKQIASLHTPPNDKLYTILQLDLDDLDSIPLFVDKFTKLNLYGGRLDYLINNAGAMVTGQKLIKVAPIMAIKNNTQSTFSFYPIDTPNLPTNNTTPSTTTSSSTNPSLTTTNPTTTTTSTSTTTQQQSQQSSTSTNTSTSSNQESTSSSNNINNDNNNTTETLITSIDNSFSTNHLGHFLLTILLLPYILKRNTRIVNVSSAIHVSVKANIDITAVLMNNESSWDAPTAYGNTKICNIWFTQALQRRLDRYFVQQQQTTNLENNNNNIVKSSTSSSLLLSSSSSLPTQSRIITKPSTFVVHPGTVWSPFHMPYYIKTANGLLLWFPLLMAPMSYFSMKSTRQGAMTTLHCCLGRSTIHENDIPLSIGPQPGQFHSDCRVSAMSPVGANEIKQEELWQMSLLLCRRYVNPTNYPLFNIIQ